MFPGFSVAHLEEVRGTTEPSGEVGAENTASGTEIPRLAQLEVAGFRLGLLALPAAVEDSFYRYNNLPARLAALYRGVDPIDPDEDLLEEAEPVAMRMISQSYLLDEVIDAIYQGLDRLPDELILRRADEEPRALLGNRRAVLLGIKEKIAADWRVASVAERLASTFSIAVAARPLLVHQAAVGPPDQPLSNRASELLGHDVEVWLDEADRVVRVR